MIIYSELRLIVIFSCNNSCSTFPIEMSTMRQFKEFLETLNSPNIHTLPGMSEAPKKEIRFSLRGLTTYKKEIRTVSVLTHKKKRRKRMLVSKMEINMY